MFKVIMEITCSINIANFSDRKSYLISSDFITISARHIFNDL